jgi:hypothetical protein
MPHDDIIHWRFGDVAERLLAGHSEPAPPPDWRCWIEPAPALPIDEMISDLRRRNREPRLRSRPELSADGIACPFYQLRFAVAAAVDVATEAASEDPAQMAKRWRSEEEKARRAAQVIKDIAASLPYSELRPTPRLPLVEPLELISAYKMVMLLRHMGTFDCIGDYARRYRQLFQYDRGEPYNLWRAVFVADLGFVWVALTGESPARTEPFIEFIVAAFASIADGQPEESWERSIRRALALGLDWRGRGNSFSEVLKNFSRQ